MLPAGPGHTERLMDSSAGKVAGHKPCASLTGQGLLASLCKSVECWGDQAAYPLVNCSFLGCPQCQAPLYLLVI
jgi:hypothetical protein